MKTIKEVYGYNFRCDVYSDGTLYPSSSGLLYPDDAVWRVGAHIEFQKVTSAIFHIIYDYIESCKDVDKAEFETLYRFYPSFQNNGYATVLINNKPTMMRVGKLLRKCFNLTDSQVRDLVDMLTIQDGVTTVSFTRNEEEILSAYTKVRSCMSGSSLPLIYLQQPDCYLAVVRHGEKVVGRTWVRCGERTTVYAFGLYKETVKKALANFQENSYFLEGASFISHDGKFPYLDSCYGRVDYDDSKVTITPEGEFRISEDGFIIKG